MLSSPKTIDALKAIGLNKYERNLWTALLSRGASTAGELADISNVPRSRCYDVLESLANRGFIVIQPGKPMKYIAVPPREAFERAKKKVLEESTQFAEKIESIKKTDVIKELEKLHRDTIKVMRPEDMTGALRGRYAVLQQLETMFKNAKKSMKLVTTSTGLVDLAENCLPLIKRASESGVQIKVVAPVNKQNAEVAKALSKYVQLRNNQEAEHVERILGRMFIIDGEEMLIGLTDDEKTHPTQDMALWTQSSHATAQVFDPIFDLIWHNSKNVKTN